MRARDHKPHSDARSRGMQPPCPCGRGESLSDFHFWLPCCTCRAEQDCHDGRSERPATGHGRSRSHVRAVIGRPDGPQTCGRLVGGAGKSFVVSRRTSSLLKRSPIPASPTRWKEVSSATLSPFCDPEAESESRIGKAQRASSLARQLRSPIGAKSRSFSPV